jgi:hypothetical protein
VFCPTPTNAFLGAQRLPPQPLAGFTAPSSSNCGPSAEDRHVSPVHCGLPDLPLVARSGTASRRPVAHPRPSPASPAALTSGFRERQAQRISILLLSSRSARIVLDSSVVRRASVLAAVVAPCRAAASRCSSGCAAAGLCPSAPASSAGALVPLSLPLLSSQSVVCSVRMRLSLQS